MLLCDIASLSRLSIRVSIVRNYKNQLLRPSVRTGQQRGRIIAHDVVTGGMRSPVSTGQFALGARASRPHQVETHGAGGRDARAPSAN
jgi:hypothetical protein